LRAQKTRLLAANVFKRNFQAAEKSWLFVFGVAAGAAACLRHWQNPVVKRISMNKFIELAMSARRPPNLLHSKDTLHGIRHLHICSFNKLLLCVQCTLKPQISTAQRNKQ